MAGPTNASIKIDVVEVASDEDDEDKKHPGNRRCASLRKQDDATTEEKRLKAAQQKERRKLKYLEKRANRTVEQRERDKARIQEQYQMKKEKLKEERRLKMSLETPEEAELRRARRREQLRIKRASMTYEEKCERAKKKYFEKQAMLARLTEEERKEKLRKNCEYVKNYATRLPPEKREAMKQKHYERCKIRLKKYTSRKEFKERFNLYQRNKIATETPEQRQTRLRNYKIHAARRKLKRQLEEEGTLSQEEIEKRLKQLVEEMKSEPLPALTADQLSQYKPRPSGRKPKNKGNVDVVEEEEPIGPRCRPTLPRGRVPLWLRPLPTTTTATNPTPSFDTTVSVNPSSPIQSQSLTTSSPKYAQSESSLSKPPIDSTVTTHDCPSPQFSPCDDDNSPSEEDELLDIDVLSPSYTLNIEPATPASQSNTCPHCNLTFSTSLELISHITCDHPWKCPTCSETMSSSAHLALHYKIKHSRREVTTFLCMCCPWNNVSKVNAKKKGPSEFKTHKRLLEHVRRFHSSNYWPCPACSLLLYSENRYKNHFTVCSQTLKLNLNMKSNSRRSTSTKAQATVCHVCGKCFSNTRVYKNHMAHFHQLSDERVKFTCPKCALVCLDSRAFLHHYGKCASLIPEPFVSPTASLALPPPKVYRQDKKNDEGPFACDQCPKMFVQRCTLDDHIRRDHEELSFLCPDCGRNFQSAGKLWRHQAERHGKTDLPPPPGTEVVRCKYCNDFVMRGYEFHVKKKHPKCLEDFRLNEHPQVKKLLAKAKILNPKKRYKQHNSNHRQYFDGVVVPNIVDRPHSKKRRVECNFCSMVLTQKCFKRHLMRFHPEKVSGPVERNIKCPDSHCNSKFRFRSDYTNHYAEVHAFSDIENMLQRKNFIRFLRPSSERHDKNREATCLKCNMNLPTLPFSVRAHFLDCHFQIIQEVLDM